MKNKLKNATLLMGIAGIISVFYGFGHEQIFVWIGSAMMAAFVFIGKKNRYI